MPFLIIVPLVLVLVWVISEYNFFVSTKARIKASVQEIGNQLKRQADLIPNLEASVKGFLKQEKGIFEMLAKARMNVMDAASSGNVQKMVDAGSELAKILPKLQIAVEDNPEIKSDKVVAKLMDELRDTSDKVMYARRLLIDLTADYNVRRATFPSNIIAQTFKFEEQKGLVTDEAGSHLRVDSSETETPKVSL